jgi:hypothetical protein
LLLLIWTNGKTDLHGTMVVLGMVHRNIIKENLS